MSTCAKTSGLSDDDSDTTKNKVLIQDIIQLLSALMVNIISVHLRGVVFPRALARGKTTSKG
jgi:hypothetical protein